MTRQFAVGADRAAAPILGTWASLVSVAAHLLSALCAAALGLWVMRSSVLSPVQTRLPLPDALPPGPWLASGVALFLAVVALWLVRRALAGMQRRGCVMVLRDRVVLVDRATGKIDRAIPFLTIAQLRQSPWAVTLTLTSGGRLTLLKPPSAAGYVGQMFDRVSAQVDDARVGWQAAA